MTDLILQSIRNPAGKRLKQILSDEKKKMFAEKKPIVKGNGGEPPKLRIGKKRVRHKTW
jgi:hypothetical protein